jgi:uncharacterized membrane protein YhaH (DUF805 family)
MKEDITIYVKHAFENIFNFNDRANRKEYWFFNLFLVVLALGLILAFAIIYFRFLKQPRDQVFGKGYDLFDFWFGTFWAFSSIAITVRRLHDLGLSKWLALLNFVPYVNFVFEIVIGCIPAKPGPNEYGEKAYDPHDPIRKTIVYKPHQQSQEGAPQPPSAPAAPPSPPPPGDGPDPSSSTPSGGGTPDLSKKQD